MAHYYKQTTFAILSAFLLAGVFGSTATLYANAAVMGDSLMGMTHQAAGMHPTCPMTADEHTEWWNTFFAAAPCAKTSLPTIVLIVFSLSFLSVGVLLYRQGPIAQIYRFGDQWPPPLQELFSSGLLHPRVYA